MPVQYLVIVAPNREAVHLHLRELDIPPPAFLKRNVVIMTGKRDMDRIKGIGAAHWAVMPRHTVSMELRHILQAHCRGGQMDLDQAIVRHLAWRHYHEC